MDDEHADQPAPQQAGEAAASDCRRARRPSRNGTSEPERPPTRRTCGDPADHRVVDEVARVALLQRALGVDEQPADVRVEQAAQRAAHAAAVTDVRAVRVALLVGVRVVLAVVGDPRDDRALDRRRPERSASDAARARAGLERAVGEQAVEADGHAAGAQQRT